MIAAGVYQPDENFATLLDCVVNEVVVWRKWLRKTRKFQKPQPLHCLIRDYRAQRPGSVDAGSS